MDYRPGYKEVLLEKHGIKISPIGIGYPGSECFNFRIEITKTKKNGEVVKVNSKNSDKLYPKKGTKKEPGIYEKIDEIKDYYYKKLTS